MWRVEQLDLSVFLVMEFKFKPFKCCLSFSTQLQFNHRSCWCILHVIGWKGTRPQKIWLNQRYSSNKICTVGAGQIYLVSEIEGGEIRRRTKKKKKKGMRGWDVVFSVALTLIRFSLGDRNMNFMIVWRVLWKQFRILSVNYHITPL